LVKFRRTSERKCLEFGERKQKVLLVWSLPVLFVGVREGKEREVHERIS
jgi:hypothetical protein